MKAFALYRLPRQKQVVFVGQREGRPSVVTSLAELNSPSGFVVAPFNVTPDQPVVLIRPDVIQTFDEVSSIEKTLLELESVSFIHQTEHSNFLDVTHVSSERQTYSDDFARFHAAVSEGEYRKLVLARCCLKKRVNPLSSPLELFEKACSLYPRLFVVLVYTPISGLWLVASPEILLEGDDVQWRTIALAGTMKLSPEEMLTDDLGQMSWSVKNIEEQHYVATYIMDCLRQFSDDIHEEGPRTVRAANLVHLRSDFLFTLYNNARVGDLLHALHPTPAVCGLPKEAARRFILENEYTSRHYYSGFVGPLKLGGLATHLYVSLRCMQICPDYYDLYAGGGILKESTEEQEWLETEAKMETMLQLID